LCTETILQFQIQSHLAKELVEQCFEPLPVDIRELESRHDFRVRKQLGWIFLHVGEPAFRFSPSYADLANHGPVFRYEWMFALLLMGPDGAFITGSDFLMDGGVTATYWFGELAPV
jgi:hypothetical protein